MSSFLLPGDVVTIAFATLPQAAVLLSTVIFLRLGVSMWILPQHIISASATIVLLFFFNSVAIMYTLCLTVVAYFVLKIGAFIVIRNVPTGLQRAASLRLLPCAFSLSVTCVFIGNSELAFVSMLPSSFDLESSVALTPAGGVVLVPQGLHVVGAEAPILIDRSLTVVMHPKAYLRCEESCFVVSASVSSVTLMLNRTNVRRPAHHAMVMAVKGSGADVDGTILENDVQWVAAEVVDEYLPVNRRVAVAFLRNSVILFNEVLGPFLGSLYDATKDVIVLVKGAATVVFEFIWDVVSTSFFILSTCAGVEEGAAPHPAANACLATGISHPSLFLLWTQSYALAVGCLRFVSAIVTPVVTYLRDIVWVVYACGGGHDDMSPSCLLTSEMHPWGFYTVTTIRGAISSLIRSIVCGAFSSESAFTATCPAEPTLLTMATSLVVGLPKLLLGCTWLAVLFALEWLAVGLSHLVAGLSFLISSAWSWHTATAGWVQLATTLTLMLFIAVSIIKEASQSCSQNRFLYWPQLSGKLMAALPSVVFIGKDFASAVFAIWATGWFPGLAFPYLIAVYVYAPVQCIYTVLKFYGQERNPKAIATVALLRFGISMMLHATAAQILDYVWEQTMVTVAMVAGIVGVLFFMRTPNKGHTVVSNAVATNSSPSVTATTTTPSSTSPALSQK